MGPHAHRTLASRPEPLPSAADGFLKGIVLMFLLQAAITTALGLLHWKFEHEWLLEKVLLASWVLTFGSGFYLLVRGCRPIEKVLVAIGYFPMTLFWLLDIGALYPAQPAGHA